MFCKTVWNGIHILPDGYIRLCSLGITTKPELDMQRCRDDDGNVMHILTHSIMEIMNSDKHRAVRLANMASATTWSPHCECCETREIATNFNLKHKNRSRRSYLMKVDTEAVSEHNFQKMADSSGRIDWMPNSLDIRFGNLCNQKCIMCSPVFSNMWYDEYFDYYKTTSFGQGQKITVSKNINTGKWDNPAELQWFEDPRWWSKFEEMMPHLRHIYITGGEPMVAPAHDIMLDKLIDAGFSKNIWLEYDTNCNAINDKIMQRWTKFKKVDVRGSMDAIEDQYEIIRYPGKWDKFTKNIQILKQYEKDSGGIMDVLALSSCFQITTAYSVIESEEWCKSMGVDFHLRFLSGPLHHSVSILSDDSKRDLLEYYKQHLTTNTKAPMIVNYLNNQIGKNNHNPIAVAEFTKFMDYLDRNRNTNWASVFPEVYNMISKDLSR